MKEKMGILLTIILLCLLISVPSCSSQVSNTTTNLLSSDYPADISGHVVIAEKIRSKEVPEDIAPNREEDVFWIINVTIKNKTYNNEVALNDWKIIAGNEEYEPKKSPWINSPNMSVSSGQIGQTKFRFNVPSTLQISEARLCYQGQEPYSFGELVGGDRVAVYDWDLQIVAEVTIEEDDYEQYLIDRVFVGYKTVDKIGDLPITERIYQDKFMELKTIITLDPETAGNPQNHYNMAGVFNGHFWAYEINIPKGPWVMNFYYIPREFGPLELKDIDVFFNARIDTPDSHSNIFSSGVGEQRGTSEKNVTCVVGQKTGTYVMRISCSNVDHIADWWLKIGVE